MERARHTAGGSDEGLRGQVRAVQVERLGVGAWEDREVQRAELQAGQEVQLSGFVRDGRGCRIARAKSGGGTTRHNDGGRASRFVATCGMRAGCDVRCSWVWEPVGTGGKRLRSNKLNLVTN